MATNPALATETFYMTSAEKRKIDFDFTDRLDTGRALAAGTPTITLLEFTTASGVTVVPGSIVVSGNLVQCFIAEGATPGVYILRAEHIDDGSTVEELVVDGKVVVTS